MASGSIYKKCEESEKPNLILERAGRFQPQHCGCGSERKSIAIFYVVNIVSFLLWIIIVAIMISKYSEMSKELDELRRNGTVLRVNGLNMEKQLQVFHSNQSAYESMLNTNLKKLEADQNSTKKNMIQKMDDLKIQSGNNLAKIFKLEDVLYKINGSGCQLCPDGWLLNRGQCYGFQVMSKHWSFAKKSCENYMGHLVIINDREEQMFLQSQLRNKNYWIGLNDMQTENKFIWVDNTPLTFTWWYPREPNNDGKGEDCVLINYAGFWQDRACGSTTDGWICEKTWNC